ncbi:MAG TPA: hypothetical protein VJM32_01970 [Candidatus Saccharimonadales bacterium]|nr:hypothetical protein [Candidatus Saccharimonadales bacterium]
MRFRRAIATAALVLFGAAGCGVPGVSVDGGSSSQPATVSIDSNEALKAALVAAGIQDVHPVTAPDANTVAAWAAVPKFKKCPVLFTAAKGGQYKAVKLQKPDKTQANLEGLPAQPDVLAFASWALTHMDLMSQCQGDTAPVETEWPTTV